MKFIAGGKSQTFRYAAAEHGTLSYHLTIGRFQFWVEIQLIPVFAAQAEQPANVGLVINGLYHPLTESGTNLYVLTIGAFHFQVKVIPHKAHSSDTLCEVVEALEELERSQPERDAKRHQRRVTPCETAFLAALDI